MSKSVFEGIEGKDYREIFKDCKTPAYIIDEGMLVHNGKILNEVASRCGCKILLAQKAFSCFNFYPVMSQYVSGTEASGLYEARLGYEEMPGKEVHVFCAAYRDDEFDELLLYADHIVFNSPYQLARFGAKAKAKGIEVGLRINPEHSTQDGHEIYDPCAPGSRLGTTKAQWDAEMTPELINMLDGVHFHTLCEQDSDALEETLIAVEKQFGQYFTNLKWINMGGGHHITRSNYDLDRLCRCITNIKNRWNVQVYLEPGEAWALNSGYMLTTILDILHNGEYTLAITDVSAACHMPDVIEMPYRPPLYDSLEANEGKYTYRLGGPTCLAGDVIGDYGFNKSLERGDRLLFGDMAIYSICKNNTFNGMPLPAIMCLKSSGEVTTVKQFDYYDFKHRLGKKD